jgi:hypothetical protein
MRTERGSTKSPGAILNARSAARRAEGRKPGVILPAQPDINVDVNERKQLRRVEMRTERGSTKSPGAILNARSAARRVEHRMCEIILPARLFTKARECRFW